MFELVEAESRIWLAGRIQRGVFSLVEEPAIGDKGSFLNLA